MIRSCRLGNECYLDIFGNLILCKKHDSLNCLLKESTLRNIVSMYFNHDKFGILLYHRLTVCMWLS